LVGGKKKSEKILPKKGEREKAGAGSWGRISVGQWRKRKNSEEEKRWEQARSPNVEKKKLADQQSQKKGD